MSPFGGFGDTLNASKLSLSPLVRYLCPPLELPPPTHAQGRRAPLQRGIGIACYLSSFFKQAIYVPFSTPVSLPKNRTG